MSGMGSINCPKCGASFEPSEAFSKQIEEKVLAGQKEQHARDKAAAVSTALKKFQVEQADISARLQRETEEERERNRKLLAQLDELTSQIRELRRKDEERELAMKKRLIDEEEKIRLAALRQAADEHDLKDREKDKKLSDALKQVEELKTKIQQGSQQTQGEVLELELEELLRREFVTDIIEEVKKGVRGADILQRVVDKMGRPCGTILWESKNAQWQQPWIVKLKEDMRQAKAELAVLVATHPPEGVNGFSYLDGIWIVTRPMILPLALALRFDLVRVNHERQNHVGQSEKMAILYEYVTSVEFKHRIEAILESFTGMQDELEREKRWFQTKWARQEKHLRKVMDHTHGMYGELQGVVGKSLPEIQTLQIESGNTGI